MKNMKFEVGNQRVFLEADTHKVYLTHTVGEPDTEFSFPDHESATKGFWLMCNTATDMENSGPVLVYSSPE